MFFCGHPDWRARLGAIGAASWFALVPTVPGMAQDTLVVETSSWGNSQGSNGPWGGAASGIEVNLDVLNLAPPPRSAPDLLPPPESLPPRSSNLARFRARAPAALASVDGGSGAMPERVPSPSHEPPPAPTQMAALPPAALPEPAAGERLRLVFAPGSTALGELAAELDAAAARLGAGTGRVQIFAHATPTDASATSARRIALKRALAVRGSLIARGIPSAQIDVRALGDSAGALDAVDVVVAP